MKHFIISFSLFIGISLFGLNIDSFADEVTGKLLKITVTIVDENGKENVFIVSESDDLKKNQSWR